MNGERTVNNETPTASENSCNRQPRAIAHRQLICLAYTATWLTCFALLVALLPSLLLRPHATIMRILPELLRARSRMASALSRVLPFQIDPVSRLQHSEFILWNSHFEGFEL